MAHERMYPLLPCRDLDEAIAFYEALGFKRTYRQLKPNPCAVVQRDDMHIHLFGMPDFKPADSYGSVIIAVPDPDELYRSFAEGLRKAFDKLPVAGIPRILRPRKKFGTVRSFSVVDVGGNWLRVFKLGDREPDESEEASGLARIIDVAARLGDAKGDDAKALKTLETGIAKHADAPLVDRARALIFRAELAVRVGNLKLAKSSLAEAERLPLDKKTKASLASELEQTRELVGKK